MLLFLALDLLAAAGVHTTVLWSSLCRTGTARSGPTPSRARWSSCRRRGSQTEWARFPPLSNRVGDRMTRTGHAERSGVRPRKPTYATVLSANVGL